MDENLRTEQISTMSFVNPDRSDWQVELFGCGPYGIVWTPAKGEVPNWFWRKMQYLILGNKWRKKHETANNPRPQWVAPIPNNASGADAHPNDVTHQRPSRGWFPRD